MKTSRELGRPGPGHCTVEFVGGPHCGDREVIPVDPQTLVAPVELARSSKAPARGDRTMTYRRRSGPERCRDGVAAWHYDAQRPEAAHPEDVQRPPETPEGQA